MQSKKAACHDVALGAIQRLQPRFNPETVNLDFDKGQKKSFKNKFPRCRRRGCLFHFTKVIDVFTEGMPSLICQCFP